MNKSKYAIALMACCIVAVAGCAGKTAGNTAQQTADEAKEYGMIDNVLKRKK